MWQKLVGVKMPANVQKQAVEISGSNSVSATWGAVEKDVTGHKVPSVAKVNGKVGVTFYLQLKNECA